MKKIILLSAPFLISLSILISSCSSDKSGSFTSRKYTKFDNRQASVNIGKPKADLRKNNAEAITTAIETESPNNTIEENSITASANNNDEVIVLEKTNTKILANAIANSLAVETAKVEEKNVSTSKRSQTTRSKAEPKKGTEYDILVLILLAIFLPPVAVYLVKGIGKTFWWNVFFTICFYLPGPIHALWVVLTQGGGGRGSDQRRSGAN